MLWHYIAASKFLYFNPLLTAQFLKITVFQSLRGNQQNFKTFNFEIRDIWAAAKNAATYWAAAKNAAATFGPQPICMGAHSFRTGFLMISFASTFRSTFRCCDTGFVIISNYFSLFLKLNEL